MQEPPLTRVSVSRTELDAFLAEEAGAFGLDLGRISLILKGQLLQIAARGDFSIHGILDELQHLEGRRPATMTKKENRFERPPLRDLWKKHFWDARFMFRNVADHFGLRHGGNTRLDSTIRQIFAENTSGEMDETTINKLSHALSVGGFEDRIRSGRGTGEWLVFAKHKGLNYYLTIGLHGDDDATFRRVADAVKDWPFTVWRSARSGGED